jgi:AraC-like DNA-binding protein
MTFRAKNPDPVVPCGMRAERCGIEITVGILGQLRKYAEGQGLDFGGIMRAAGADPGLLADPDGRIPIEAYLDIEDGTALASGDPCLGLHMGEYIEPGDWSVAGYYLSRCATLGEVFMKGGRYARIVGNLIGSKGWLVPGAVRIRLTVPRWAPAMSRHCFEGALSSSICMARRLTGRDLDPLVVRLSGERPDDDAEYRRVFRCPVQFGSKNPGMDIPLSMVSTPVLHPDPESKARFEAWAEEALARLPPLRQASERVMRLLLERLDDPRLSARAAAREMGLSLRGLQADLAGEGTDFGSLLRKAREALARDYLRTGKSVEDITCLLGFSDVSVFRKAFKKWTGMTPGEYRTAAESVA